MADEESTGERLDRELMELLQGIRVVMPGVLVLLAFLLTVPFQQRFAQLPGSLRNAFFAAIACATLATVLLIAPSTHHRLLFRAREKEWLLRVGNQMALWGTVLLGASIVLALYVVTNVLFTSEQALLTTAVAIVVFAGLWYVLPLTRRSSSTSSSDERAAEEEADEQAQESRGASSRR
jgi:glucose dehydrogenase